VSTVTRRRWALLALVIVALAALVTAGTWALARTAGAGMTARGGGPGMMGGGSGMMGGAGPGVMGGAGPGMMAGSFALPGDGRKVTTLDAARQRAQRYADGLGLRVGEVIQFSNGFYAELLTPDGQGATEVLVDPAGGAVTVEYGPAMMWNTRYGMHPGTAAATVTPAEATRLAQRWLDAQRPGEVAGAATAFPGYYTLETRRGGTVVGMMSVHATTGTVWYHTWHGRYVAATEG